MTDDRSNSAPKNALSRRLFLGAGLGFAAWAGASAPLSAAIRALPERSVSLYNINTGESLKTVYWAEGRISPQALAAVDRLLRDHRTDEIHPIDPRLLDIISAAHRRLGGKGAVHVISGYRSPHTNAVKAAADDGVAHGSLHMSGRAVDIRIPGAATKSLIKAAKTLRAGGVGDYSKLQFAHLDTGAIRYW